VEDFKIVWQLDLEICNVRDLLQNRILYLCLHIILRFSWTHSDQNDIRPIFNADFQNEMLSKSVKHFLE
jgi:hypothetical protein